MEKSKSYEIRNILQRQARDGDILPLATVLYGMLQACYPSDKKSPPGRVHKVDKFLYEHIFVPKRTELGNVFYKNPISPTTNVPRLSGQFVEAWKFVAQKLDIKSLNGDHLQPVNTWKAFGMLFDLILYLQDKPVNNGPDPTRYLDSILDGGASHSHNCVKGLNDFLGEFQGSLDYEYTKAVFETLRRFIKVLKRQSSSEGKLLIVPTEVLGGTGCIKPPYKGNQTVITFLKFLCSRRCTIREFQENERLNTSNNDKWSDYTLSVLAEAAFPECLLLTHILRSGLSQSSEFFKATGWVNQEMS